MVPKQSMKVFARAAMIAFTLVTFAVSAYGNSNNNPHRRVDERERACAHAFGHKPDGSTELRGVLCHDGRHHHH